MKVGRKKRTGIVINDKLNKTVVVSVRKLRKNLILGKVIRSVKKYKAHDENNECKVGYKVEIEECSPISRTKNYRVVRILDKRAEEKIQIKDELEELKPVKEVEKVNDSDSNST